VGQAEEVALRAQAQAEAKGDKIATTKDLQKQIDTLESATRKLVKAARDMSAEVATTHLQLAANRILFNMDAVDDKDSKSRLMNIAAQTRPSWTRLGCRRTRRQAQNIYLEAGRKSKGTAGALGSLEQTSTFAEELGPAPTPKPVCWRR
jgi:hypothetical protein